MEDIPSEEISLRSFGSAQAVVWASVKDSFAVCARRSATQKDASGLKVAFSVTRSVTTVAHAAMNIKLKCIMIYFRDGSLISILAILQIRILYIHGGLLVIVYNH